MRQVETSYRRVKKSFHQTLQCCGKLPYCLDWNEETKKQPGADDQMHLIIDRQKVWAPLYNRSFIEVHSGVC